MRPGECSPGILRPNGKGLPIGMLGVAFDNLTMPAAIAEIGTMIASGQPHYVVTANVDFLAQARNDVELRRILFDADLVLCDGTPLLWASHWLGNRLMERVAGADLVPLLIRAAAARGHRIFFLGATPDSAADAVARLSRDFPEAIIAGHYSPPFRQLLEMDHEEIKRRITEAKPDLLLVAFGCPKAEKWIAMHYRSLGVPVAIGVGATIDFLAGRVRRAPLWMRRSGTEWVFRLLQEPRRLMRRYARDLGFFGWSIFEQWRRLRRRTRRNGRVFSSNGVSGASVTNHSAARWGLITAPPHLDAAAVRTNPELSAASDPHFDLLADLSAVERIDSTGVALLIAWHKRLRRSRRRLVLIAPGPAVSRALEFMRLREFFLCAPDFGSAQQLLESRDQEDAVQMIQGDPASGAAGLVWRGEITAANADRLWELAHSTLASLPNGWVIDLSGVPYIDSSGLGLLIRAKKLAQSQGHGFRLVGLQPAVRNVLRHSRLEEYLLGSTNGSGPHPNGAS